MAQEEATDRIIIGTAAFDPDETTEALPAEFFTEPEAIQGTSAAELENLPYINPELLSYAQQFRQHWDLIQDRLQKIKAHQGKVRESVYRKVAADYTARLDATRQQLLAIKHDVDKELEHLERQAHALETEFNQHQDALEEGQFRYQLGEHTTEAFHDLAAQEQNMLRTLESELTAVRQAINLYNASFNSLDMEEARSEGKTTEPILSAEELQPAVNVATPAESKPPQVTPSAHSQAPTKPIPDDEPAPLPRAEKKPAPAAKLEKPASVSPKKAPAVELRYSLSLYENGEAQGQFALNNELSMGRSPSNDIVLNETRVSRRHAIIRKSGTDYRLVDNSSANGTYVNGTAITEHVLKPNDHIQIGSFELVFHAAESTKN